MQYAETANELFREAKRLRNTVRQCWPEWNWQVPGEHTPDVWTLRILKPLAFFARRCPAFGKLVGLLEGEVIDRLEDRRNARGISLASELQGSDVRKLVEELKSNEVSTLALVNESLMSAESPEACRADDGQPLGDVSSSLQENGFQLTQDTTTEDDFLPDLQPEGEDQPRPQSQPQPQAQPRACRAGPALSQDDRQKNGERFAASLHPAGQQAKQRMRDADRNDLHGLVRLHREVQTAENDLALFAQFWQQSSLSRG